MHRRPCHYLFGDHKKSCHGVIFGSAWNCYCLLPVLWHRLDSEAFDSSFSRADSGPSVHVRLGETQKTVDGQKVVHATLLDDNLKGIIDQRVVNKRFNHTRQRPFKGDFTFDSFCSSRFLEDTSYRLQVLQKHFLAKTPGRHRERLRKIILEWKARFSAVQTGLLGPFGDGTKLHKLLEMGCHVLCWRLKDFDGVVEIELNRPGVCKSLEYLGAKFVVSVGLV